MHKRIISLASSPSPSFSVTYFTRLISATSLLFIFSLTSVSALTSVSTSNTNFMRNGLVGYWTFDGKNMSNATATDSSGSGNNGTLTNMAATSSASSGKLGQALTFNGTTAYIDVGTGKYPFTKTTSFSGAVWIKTSTSTSQTIMSNFNLAVSSGWYFSRGSTISLTLTDSALGNKRIVSGSTSINDGKWHHVSFTYDGSNTAAGIKLYVDGKLETLTIISDTDPVPTFTDSGFHIGDVRFGGGGFFNFQGSLDDVRLYNRTLSPTEIQSLYKAGGGIAMSAVSTATASSSSTGINSGLAGYWTLDRKNLTNATATDISGNGKNGTLSGGLSGTANVTTGKIREGLTFNGSSAYIDIGTGKYVYTNTTPFSGSAWVKTTNNGSQAIMSNLNFLGTAGWFLNVGTTLGFMMINVGGTNVIQVYSNVIKVNDGKWHHVGFTNDGSHTAAGIKLFIDGKQVSITVNSDVDPGALGDYGFKIGEMDVLGAPNYYMNGSLDDIRLYSRVVSATEMNTLYKQGGSTIAAVTGNNTPKVGINSGLVGYWTFDGKNMTNATATDSSGSGNNGTLVSGPLKTIGKIGQGLSLSGSNYLDITNTSFAGQFTFSAWYNTSNNAQTGMIFGEVTGGSSFSPKIGINTNAFFVRIGTSTSDSSIALPSANKWHHLVVTRDSSNKIDLYVDGGPANRLFSNGAQTETYVLDKIGTNGSIGQSFTGKLDDVRIYNRTLSSTEIKSLYKFGTQ